MADQSSNSNSNSSSVINKKEGMMTYSYILLYIALSSGQIFFNKWVLSSKEINFPYPLGLTLLHMIFSSVLCFVHTKVLKILKVEEGMTLEIFCLACWSAVVQVAGLSLPLPIGLLPYSVKRFLILVLLNMPRRVIKLMYLHESWELMVMQPHNM